MQPPCRKETVVELIWGNCKRPIGELIEELTGVNWIDLETGHAEGIAEYWSELLQHQCQYHLCQSVTASSYIHSLRRV